MTSGEHASALDSSQHPAEQQSLAVKAVDVRPVDSRVHTSQAAISRVSADALDVRSHCFLSHFLIGSYILVGREGQFIGNGTKWTGAHNRSG